MPFPSAAPQVRLSWASDNKGPGFAHEFEELVDAWFAIAKENLLREAELFMHRWEAEMLQRFRDNSWKEPKSGNSHFLNIAAQKLPCAPVWRPLQGVTENNGQAMADFPAAQEQKIKLAYTTSSEESIEAADRMTTIISLGELIPFHQELPHSLTPHCTAASNGQPTLSKHFIESSPKSDGFPFEGRSGSYNSTVDSAGTAPNEMAHKSIGTSTSILGKIESQSSKRSRNIASKTVQRHTESDKKLAAKHERSFQKAESAEIDATLKVIRSGRLDSTPCHTVSEPMSRGYFLFLLRHPRTEKIMDSIMAGAILTNVVQIGASADVHRSWHGWLVCDCIFAAIFALEFLLKIAIHGLCSYLLGPQWKAAFFDMFIVSLAIFELIAAAIFRNSTEVSIFRVVRLLRLFRILKVLRLPIFKDLLTMCEGLMHGARTLAWSIALLFAPIFASAIVMRETVGERSERLPEDTKNLIEPFSSLPLSFFTCFRCIMGDCSSASGQPLAVIISRKFGWLYAVSYVLLIMVTSFGLFNVIIAIYVENIVAAARRKETHEQRLRLGDEDLFHVLMAELVHAFVHGLKRDSNTSVRDLQSAEALEKNCESQSTHFHRSMLSVICDPNQAIQVTITKAVFDSVTASPQVEVIFERLEIPYEERLDLFDVLDADGNGSLTLGEILKGLRVLRGNPRRSDLIGISLRVRMMQERNHHHFERLAAGVTRTIEECGILRGDVEHFFRVFSGLDLASDDGSATITSTRVMSRQTSPGFSELSGPRKMSGFSQASWPYTGQRRRTRSEPLATPKNGGSESVSLYRSERAIQRTRTRSDSK